MRRFPKRAVFLLVVLAALLALAGCNGIYSIFNPLIGTWEYTYTSGSSTMTIDYTFNWDNSFEETVSSGGASSSVTGTFTQDTGAQTVTITVTSGGSSSTQTFGYSVNGNTLTLTMSGSSADFTRK